MAKHQAAPPLCLVLSSGASGQGVLPVCYERSTIKPDRDDQTDKCPPLPSHHLMEEVQSMSAPVHLERALRAAPIQSQITAPLGKGTVCQ